MTKLQDDFFRDDLHRTRQIHMLLHEGLCRITWRPAEQGTKAIIGHGQAGAIIEIIHIHPEGTVFFDIDKMVVNLLNVLWLAIRSQAHDLVFPVIHLEAQIIGEGGIKHADGMGKADFFCQCKVIPFADA